jgi:fluoride ion exporter CrcB/FEX
MSFMTNVLIGVLVCAVAFFLMRRFGPQGRVWHALSLAAGFAGGMTTPSTWNSVVAHFSLNIAIGLLIVWGVLGLTVRTQWQKHG